MGESVSGEHQGAARWLSIHDDLLRGLTHALSNRVGTISAIAYMLELKPAALDTTVATLRAESEQLEELLHLMRVLPRRADAVFEPVIPTDATTQALKLHAHHPEFRDMLVRVHVEGDMQPAYVDPAVLTMAVAAALGAVHCRVGTGGEATLTISSTTDVVRMTVQPTVPSAHDTAEAGDALVERVGADAVGAIAWLLAPYGGVGTTEHQSITVVIPTLQAARRTMGTMSRR